MSKTRKTVPQPVSAAAATQERIKQTASRLFANRGIDGVSVRDIVVASGQKNGGSLHYYFRTKEALVRGLVAEGAKLIDERRNKLLDQLESRRRRPTLHEIIEALLWPSTDLETDPAHPSTYIRFITNLRTNHRELFLEALERKWDSGYRRCIAHIRRLLAHLPAALVNQRLIFMSLYLQATLSARESALEHHDGHNRLWFQPETCENLIDTVCGLLTEPPSAKTLKLARTEAKR
jgi:AcrR family transcriptional regulator